uniref:(northern house mosquito) hypothetical protein n=1 Tax=Culex pipiens TaxID=7175 RepID=A0A8D8N498_CULPI
MLRLHPVPRVRHQGHPRHQQQPGAERSGHHADAPAAAAAAAPAAAEQARPGRLPAATGRLHDAPDWGARWSADGWSTARSHPDGRPVQLVRRHQQSRRFDRSWSWWRQRRRIPVHHAEQLAVAQEPHRGHGRPDEPGPAAAEP